MLIELRIRNVAVIDMVSLPLAKGLNVLTGETGAGKSLIVGALGLLLGERAATDRIRAGAERATVEGVFELGATSPLREILDERGIDTDADTLVLKREVSISGRSRAWINGSPVTAAVLAEIGARLVSILGQHDSRQLVEAEQQREVLDAFAGAIEVRSRVEEAYARVAALRTRERELALRRTEAAKRADYLRFVLFEVEDSQVVSGEDESLENEIRRLAHAEELQATAAQAAAAISGDDRAALSRLAVVRRALSALVRIDPETARWQAGFDSAVYGLDELVREFESYAESVEADPQRLRTLERRRDQLVTLMRKYGPTLQDVIATGAEARRELEFVDGSSLDAEAVAEARAVAEGALAEASLELSRQRQSAAQRLAAGVTELLPELGLPEGRFHVVLTPTETVGAYGAEQVNFIASLNAGSEATRLGRLASGGELSRVMLALSTMLARVQRVPTLVFDEVDAGIGGGVAWQVGALMRKVATYHQVLAISHLAQIAARAHHHVVVQKSAVGTVTMADTLVVSDDERVVEIARMLGGDADREVSRAHARELLARGDVDAVESPPSSSGRQRRGKPV